MKTSEELGDLATAMAIAQGELSDAEKSSDNPFFKSKYADLAEVLGQIRPIFSKHGLSLVQFPGQEHEGHVQVTTRLMHKSGQWMEGTLSMPVQGKNIAQDSGSVITYMRRYAAAAVAGIAQVDSDANQAQNKSESLSAPKPKEEWYNTLEADKDAIKGAMEGGKTPEMIISQIEGRGMKISKEVRTAISNMGAPY